jgi:SAM-dependent methyltransferase
MKNYVPWYNRLRFAWHCYNNPQQTPSDTYQKYPKGSTFEGRRVLNVGCGNSVYPVSNVVNTDVYPVPGVDVVWDLSKTPLPFKDQEFDFVLANHILEHIPNWWECFKELARVVKVGGTIEVWLPGDGGSSQLGYRDHINTINHCSFVGIRGTWRNHANAWEGNELSFCGNVRDIKIMKSVTRAIDYWWMQLLPECALNWCIKHLRNVASEHGWFFERLPPLTEATNGN